MSMRLGGAHSTKDLGDCARTRPLRRCVTPDSWDFRRGNLFDHPTAPAAGYFNQGDFITGKSRNHTPADTIQPAMQHTRTSPHVRPSQKTLERTRSHTPDYYRRYSTNLAGSSLPGSSAAAAEVSPEKQPTRTMKKKGVCDPTVTPLTPSALLKRYTRFHEDHWDRLYQKDDTSPRKAAQQGTVIWAPSSLRAPEGPLLSGGGGGSVRVAGAHGGGGGGSDHHVGGFDQSTSSTSQVVYAGRATPSGQNTPLTTPRAARVAFDMTSNASTIVCNERQPGLARAVPERNRGYPVLQTPQPLPVQVRGYVAGGAVTRGWAPQSTLALPSFR